MLAKRDVWTGSPKGPIKLLVSAETRNGEEEMHNRGVQIVQGRDRENWEFEEMESGKALGRRVG